MANDAGLILTDEYRLETAVTVYWSGDLKLPCVTTDCLSSVLVALVWLIRLFMLGVANMVFNLSFKSSIDKRLHKLLLEVFDVIEGIHATGHLLSQFFNV